MTKILHSLNQISNNVSTCNRTVFHLDISQNWTKVRKQNYAICWNLNKQLFSPHHKKNIGAMYYKLLPKTPSLLSKFNA